MRLALVLLALLAAAAPARAQQPVSSAGAVPAGTVLDGIAAIVDEEVILRSEVDALAQQLAGQQAVSDAVWSRALDQLIDQRVFVVAARRDTTIRVSEDMVEQRLNAQIAQLARQAGGEDALAAYYNRPIDAVRALFRDDVRKQLMAQQLQQRRLRDVTVTPGEVRAWFERIPANELPMVPELVRVAHIVRKPQPSEAARQNVRRFVEALRDSVVSGQATIEELATRHTEDPGSQRTGGRYDGFNLRDLVPEFSLVAASLQPGQISQVFETSFGFHVMRLNSRQGDIVSFNHILRAVPADASGADVARAELLAFRDSVLTHGVPFEALARRHSQDPFSSSRGGYVADPSSGERDLRAEALGPRWQATLRGLQVGEISQPAEADLLDGSRAYHIVLLQRRTPPRRLSMEHHYGVLSDYALQEKRAQTLEDWARRLRQTVHIDVRSPRYTAAQAAPRR